MAEPIAPMGGPAQRILGYVLIAVGATVLAIGSWRILETIMGGGDVARLNPGGSTSGVVGATGLFMILPGGLCALAGIALVVASARTNPSRTSRDIH